MSVRELDVLIALCRAAPSVTSLDHAERLLRQIAPYLLESHTQTFRSSPLLRGFQPSPWELLTKEVTSAVLVIGFTHPSLQQSALSSINRAVDKYCDQGKTIGRSNAPPSSDEGALVERTEDITFIVSLLGFLEALSAKPATFTTGDCASILLKLQALLSERFMVAIEGTLSSIRNTHGPAVRDWRRLLRHYAASGRPLGAMLLQHAFMRYVASATALMVVPSTGIHVEDVLGHLSKDSKLQPDTYKLIDETTLEGLADLIARPVRSFPTVS